MINFSKILFVLDKRLNNETKILKSAMDYAKQNNAEIEFICVLPDLAPLHYSNSADTLADIKQSLITSTHERASNLLSSLGNMFKPAQSSISVAIGKEYVEVCKAVLNKGFDVIIKQASDPSWLDSILGSNDLHLLRKCPCAVWLIDSKHEGDFNNVVAAVDFSDDEAQSELNDTIAQHAASFATRFHSHLHVVSVCDGAIGDFAGLWASEPEQFESNYLREEERRRRFAANYLCDQISKEPGYASLGAEKMHQHIIQGTAEIVIVQKLREINADLLVMGTIARAGVSGMLVGNTAEAVFLQLPCSVLALKPADFKTPISL